MVLAFCIKGILQQGWQLFLAKTCIEKIWWETWADETCVDHRHIHIDRCKLSFWTWKCCFSRKDNSVEVSSRVDLTFYDYGLNIKMYHVESWQKVAYQIPQIHTLLRRNSVCKVKASVSKHQQDFLMLLCDNSLCLAEYPATGQELLLWMHMKQESDLKVIARRLRLLMNCRCLEECVELLLLVLLILCSDLHHQAKEVLILQHGVKSPCPGRLWMLLQSSHRKLK